MKLRQGSGPELLGCITVMPEGAEPVPHNRKRFTVPHPEAMHQLGVTIGMELAAGDAVILTGELGAGKTTLTRGIGEGMGVQGSVTSPTFVLARTHPTKQGTPLVHVDAYRLAGPEEFDDLDIDFDYSAVVIEWGEDLLEHDRPRLEVVLDREIGHELEDSLEDLDAPQPRTVTLHGVGERWMHWVERTHA